MKETISRACRDYSYLDLVGNIITRACQEYHIYRPCQEYTYLVKGGWFHGDHHHRMFTPRVSGTDINS